MIFSPKWWILITICSIPNKTKKFIVFDSKVSSPIFNKGFGVSRVNGCILLPKPSTAPYLKDSQKDEPARLL